MNCPIRVKLLSPLPARWFLHQLPSDTQSWDNCQFIFDPHCENYDWLVIYEDLPGKLGLPRNRHCEALRCPPSQTLLVTSEPASIKHYGNAYTRQFGCVLTSQSQQDLPHPDRIYQQAGLIWIYGVGFNGGERSFEEMCNQVPHQKQFNLAMVSSGKRMRMTLHKQRFNCMQRLEQLLPEMHVYGRSQGHRPLDDKAEALDSYRYSIALENHIEQHHWTEKLADAFLGLTLPFYDGCPNISDYFPEQAVIPINMRDPDQAANIIRTAIANKEYEKRLPAIHEARRRVLHEHNLFAVLAREINIRHPRPDNQQPLSICSRHALRRQSLTVRIDDTLGKMRLHLKNMFNR